MSDSPQTPSLTSSSLRRTVLALAVAAVVGCDDLGASDKTTINEVNASFAQLSSLPSVAPGDGVATVSSGLTNAANKASPGIFKAVAAGAAAGVDQQAAFASKLQLGGNEAAVRRTLVELRRLADQVNASNTYAAGYLKADPKPAVEDLSSHISAMQGNAQTPMWGPGETGTLPSLAAAKQESTKLQGELEQKQAELADLNKKRAELLSTADVQSKHADGLKGEEGVRAFADASETRRAADDLAIKIDLVQVQVDRLKADAAASDAQATIVSTGIDALKEQGKQLESGWVQTQKAVDGQKQIIAGAVNGDDKTPQSIDSTAKTLDKQLADLSAARTAALEQLNEAEKYAKMAEAEAKSFGQSISTKVSLPGKDGEAYKALGNVVNPQQYQYRLGRILSNRGSLALSQASLYTDIKAAVDATRSAIEAAGGTVPQSLADVNVTPLDQLTKDAETDFTAAQDAFTNVESGNSSKALKDAAKTARLITMFSHLSLFDLRESTGDTAAKAQATQLMSDAQALKAELVGGNVPLPALPGELGDASAGQPAAATPATPATPAATAPATPDATQPDATPPAATDGTPPATPTTPETPATP